MSSRFPLNWKTARVTPIIKSGTTGNIPADYRPISILPALSKVMEHIVKIQIESYLEERSMINPCQSGFRKHHSTNTLLLNMTDKIICSVDRKQPCLLVLLDLTKAFESVNHKKLICKLLNNFNFSRTGCSLIHSFLSNRSQFVATGTHISTSQPLTSGVPQGSILGPLLFMMYTNDIFDHIDSSLVQIYADDIQISSFSTTGSYNDCSLKICDDLSRILHWASENNIIINPNKTRAMAFGRSSDLSDPQIILNGHQIEISSSVKFLGVTFDKDLKFSSHINNVISKIWLSLRKLYSLSQFLPLKTKYRLAHAVAMPHLLYCLELYSGTNDTLLEKCQKCYNAIIRFVYNLRPRDHITQYSIQFLGYSFYDLVKIKTLLLFYKTIKFQKPPYLTSKFRFLHSSRNTQIEVERHFSSIYEHTFQSRVARLWNQLPTSLRLFTFSINSFRNALISHYNTQP